MKTHTQVLLISLASVVLVTALSLTAFAHAYLVKSEPPIGAVLQDPPEQIQLTFSEPIEPKFSSFSLYDAQGTKIDEPPFQLEQDALRSVLPLNPLTSGIYTLAWQVLSAADGHITQGTIPFAVGVTSASLSIDQASQTTSSPPTARVIVRWLGFLAAMILVGSLFFPFLLPSKQEMTQESFAMGKLLWGCWGVFILAGLVDVLFQARMLDTSPPNMLTQSRWGTMQLAKASFALALGITLWSCTRDRLSLWLARVFSALFLLAASMSGHSAVLGPLGVLADWLHQLTVALWLGGLVQLALIWIPKRAHRSVEGRVALLGALVPRFSNLAFVSVLLLLASGLYAALQQITSWGALLSTPYGQTLLAKHLLLVPVLVLAAVNRLVMKPKMIAWSVAPSANPGPKVDVESAERTLSRFRKIIAAEGLIVSLIVLFAGLLTLTAPPPGSAAFAAVSQPPVERPQLFLQPLGEYTIALSVSPVRVGNNVFEIAVTDSTGAPVGDILKVWLDLVYLDQELGPVTVVAQSTAEGHHRVEGALMSLPGNWHVTLWVRLKGQAEDLKAEFHLIVGK